LSYNDFLGKFGGTSQEDSSLTPAYAPDALGKFLGMFAKEMPSYWFYNDTVELRFDKADHIYYLVEALGNLKPVEGVTTVCHIIDRSHSLTPWAAKKVADKLIQIIPTVELSGEIWLQPMSLALFTQYVMEAKKAPQEEKLEAGDVGHMAHECLEKSIQFAIENNAGVVEELKEIPENEQAATAAKSALAWMQAHNVRWVETESKIYSKEHGYAGTMDGLAHVDSCNDRTCCRSSFQNHLSLIDWKSSNYLYIEFLFQTASYQHAKQEESNIKIEDRWVLRLGKNEDEAGKFEPWYMGPDEFEEDLNGFLACLRLTRLVQSVNDRMRDQKKIRKEIKKEEKALKKIAEKAEKKAEKARIRAEEKAEKERLAKERKEAERVAKEAEKERIKEEARKNRESITKTVVASEVPLVPTITGIKMFAIPEEN
jgi:hypothetical protein